MIPYSKPKLSDLYTLSQSKLLENHTLHSGTYLYSPYMAVPPLYFTYQHPRKRSRSSGQQLCKFIGTKKTGSTSTELVWARGYSWDFLVGGVPPGSSNPDPFQTKNYHFLHTRFQTWPLRNYVIIT